MLDDCCGYLYWAADEAVGPVFGIVEDYMRIVTDAYRL